MTAASIYYLRVRVCVCVGLFTRNILLMCQNPSILFVLNACCVTGNILGGWGPLGDQNEGPPLRHFHSGRDRERK